MKGQFKRGLLVTTALLASGVVCLAGTTVSNTGSIPNSTAPAAQSTPEPRTALPGTINYIEGQVLVNGEPLTQQSVGSTVLQPKQTISTETGYAEVLLTPGAFLRIGHNSEAQLEASGLANVKLNVLQGSAMVEVADFIRGTSLNVAMDNATTQIEKKGLYAFEANQQSIQVLDGKAQVLFGDKKTKLGKHDEVLLASDKPLKKHDVNMKLAEAEPLYTWSKVRSQQVSEASNQLAQNVAISGAWYGPGWYWNPYWGNWGFLPAWGALYSPFGWGFYSPGYIYSVPSYRPYWGGHSWGHRWDRGGHAVVPGVRGGVRAVRPGGFPHGAVRGFHGNPGGGFHGHIGGGFHGGGAAGMHGGFHGRSAGR